MMENLTQQFVRILRALLAEGFQLPLHVVCVAANGAMMAFTYQAESDESLACVERFSDEANMVLPINMMYVDARNEAVRVKIDVEGQWHQWN
jgi:hypothetical protein